MSYYFHAIVVQPFDDVLSRVSEALINEGFGIITTIDLQKTFKDKLNIEYARCTILGACNPSFVHQGLDIEKNLGLLVPCNVSVKEINENLIEVSCIDPVALLKVTKNPTLKTMAVTVQKKLKKVINTLRH